MAGAAQTASPPRTGTGRGIGGVARRLTTETKHALKTTEFYAYVVTFVTDPYRGRRDQAEGQRGRLPADKVWLYITILTVGYMIARGLAKRAVVIRTGRAQNQHAGQDNGDDRH